MLLFFGKYFLQYTYIYTLYIYRKYVIFACETTDFPANSISIFSTIFEWIFTTIFMDYENNF